MKIVIFIILNRILSCVKKYFCVLIVSEKIFKILCDFYHNYYFQIYSILGQLVLK